MMDDDSSRTIELPNDQGFITVCILVVFLWIMAFAYRGRFQDALGDDIYFFYGGVVACSVLFLLIGYWFALPNRIRFTQSTMFVEKRAWFGSAYSSRKSYSLQEIAGFEHRMRKLRHTHHYVYITLTRHRSKCLQEVDNSYVAKALLNELRNKFDYYGKQHAL